MDVEFPALAGHLGVEQDLQQQVAQLLAQEGGVPAADRVDHFMRFLDDILLKVSWVCARSHSHPPSARRRSMISTKFRKSSIGRKFLEQMLT